MTVIDEVKRGLPRTQKCKYDDRPADRRIFWAEMAAYVPVCSDECQARAVRKIGGPDAVDDIRRIPAEEKRVLVRSFDGDEWEPGFELKALNFHWDESKINRDELGQFAIVPSLGLSHLLDYPAGYPWPKVEGAPPAAALPHPKDIKPVSLRPGDVLQNPSTKTIWTITKQPKLGTDGYWTISGLKADGKIDTWKVKDGLGVTTIARTPQPKTTAKAKKDKAALLLVMGSLKAADKPVIGKVKAGAVLPMPASFGDPIVLVDADTGDQFRVTQAHKEGQYGDVSLWGVKLNDTSDTDVFLGKWPYDTELTVKIVGSTEKAALAQDKPDVDAATTANPVLPVGAVLQQKPGAGWTAPAIKKLLEQQPDATWTMTQKKDGKVFSDVKIAAAVAPGGTGWGAVGAMSGYKQKAKPGYLWMNLGGKGWKQQPVKAIGDLYLNVGESPSVEAENVKPGIYKRGDGVQIIVGPDGSGIYSLVSSSPTANTTPMPILAASVKQHLTDPDFEYQQPVMGDHEPNPATPYLGVAFLGHYTPFAGSGAGGGGQGFWIHNAEGVTGPASVTWDDGTAMAEGDWSVIAPNLTPDGSHVFKHDGVSMPKGAEDDMTEANKATITKVKLLAGAVTMESYVGDKTLPVPVSATDTVYGRQQQNGGATVWVIHADGSGSVYHNETFDGSGAYKGNDFQPGDSSIVDDLAKGNFSAYTGIEPVKYPSKQQPALEPGTYKKTVQGGGDVTLTINADGTSTYINVAGDHLSYSAADTAASFGPSGASPLSGYEFTDNTGRWVHKSGKLLTVHPSGASTLVGAHGGMHDLDDNETVNELAKPGWTKAEPDEPSVTGNGVQYNPRGTVVVLAGDHWVSNNGLLPVVQNGKAVGPMTYTNGKGDVLEVHPDGGSTYTPQGVVGAPQDVMIQGDAAPLDGTIKVSPYDHVAAGTYQLSDGSILLVGGAGYGSFYDADGKPQAIGSLNATDLAEHLSSMYPEGITKLSDTVALPSSNASAPDPIGMLNDALDSGEIADGVWTWSGGNIINAFGDTAPLTPKPGVYENEQTGVRIEVYINGAAKFVADNPHEDPEMPEPQSSSTSFPPDGWTFGSSSGWPKHYVHPQGGFITVANDGTMTAFDKHGMKKSTSATPEKLEAGHGQWKEVVPTTVDTPKPIYAAIGIDAGPWKPGKYKSQGAGILVVNDDGMTGSWYVGEAELASTSGVAVDAKYLGNEKIHGKFTEDTGFDLLALINGDAPLQPGLYGSTDDTGGGYTIHVKSDGTATLAYGASAGEPLDMDTATAQIKLWGGDTVFFGAGVYDNAEQSKTLIIDDVGVGLNGMVGNIKPSDVIAEQANWIYKAPAVPAIDYSPPVAGTNPPAGGNANGNLVVLEGMDPALVKLAQGLDYPADYAWPQVPGAPPAKPVKGGSSQVKAVSLRAGDVVDAKDWGYDIGSVVTSKKHGTGWKVTVLFGDGSHNDVIMDTDETITSLARTPQPKDFAAMKKAKKQLEAGHYGAPSAPDGPAPGQLVGTGPALSDKTKAAAKPKPAYYKAASSVGSVVLLPNGGSMTVTKKGAWESAKWMKDGHTYKQRPGKYMNSTQLQAEGWTLKGGGYKLVGIPSIDAAPEYLSTDENGTVIAELIPDGGKVMWVPKSALNKKGATVIGAKPPSAQTVVTPPSTPTVNTTPKAAPVADSDILSTVGWKNVGPQGGSNPGGLFESPDGTRYYVKASKHGESRTDNEVVAARLYTAAGVAIPDVRKATITPELGLSSPTKIGVASRIVDGKKNLATKYTDAAYRKKIVDGFAVDAWLANWDAAGTGKDNMIEVNGEPLRVDVGGSLLYRAQGTPKAEAFGATVTETTTLLDHSKNADAADVYGKVTKAELKDSFVKHVMPITPQQIDKIVDENVGDATDRALLKQLLKARRLDLAKQVGIAEKDLPENVVPAYPKVDMAATGGHAIPYAPGAQVTSDVVTLDKKDVWFHRTVLKATQVQPGMVLYLNEPGISSVQNSTSLPWVVTKIAPKPTGSGNGEGKPGIWGKLGGEGVEHFMFIQVPSGGERDVWVQTEPPPGWKPPPPPPPPKPGEKLVLTGKLKQPHESASPGATTGLQQMWSTLKRATELANAYKLVTPEQKVALDAAGWDTQAKFVSAMSHISSSWDGSSNSSVEILAFHHAIAVEFGLDDTVAWPSEHANMNTKKQVQDHFVKWGSAYQAAARLIYQNTQNQLAKRGIEYVKVYRGFSFSAPKAGGGGGSPAPPWAWTNGVHTDVVLRPISSGQWQNTWGGNVKITGIVPRELILSAGPTGLGFWGSGGEYETVILGVKGVPWEVTGAVKPPVGYTADKFYQDYPVWTPGSLATPGMQHKAMEWGDDDIYEALLNEDMPKVHAQVWPFVDEDGDEVTSVAELTDLYPELDLSLVLDMPVARWMPDNLHAELMELLEVGDEDGIGPFGGGMGQDAIVAAEPEQKALAYALPGADDDGWV